MRWPTTRHESFIVRLSAEALPAGGGTVEPVAEPAAEIPAPGWHGEVEHSRTGRVWRFASLAQLPSILRAGWQATQDHAHE